MPRNLLSTRGLNDLKALTMPLADNHSFQLVRSFFSFHHSTLKLYIQWTYAISATRRGDKTISKWAIPISFRTTVSKHWKHKHEQQCLSREARTLFRKTHLQGQNKTFLYILLNYRPPTWENTTGRKYGRLICLLNLVRLPLGTVWRF